MIKTAVIHEGRVINIGPWQYELESGEANPLPDGAIEGEFDVTQTADGRYVLADNYRSLRSAEYPPIGDQLDALFHAGVFPAEMSDLIAAIKAKYPKP